MSQTPPARTVGRAPPAELRIQLLGSFNVAVGGQVVPDGLWRRRAAKSLVKILALAPGHRRHRDEIMEGLWPHLGANAAANNLRQTLYAARRALRPRSGAAPSHDDIQLLGDLVVLATDPTVWIDVDSFVSALGKARAAHDPADYRAALDRYPGDLLPEDQYEDWVVPRRDQLRGMHHAALFELGHLLEASGDAQGAIEQFRTLVGRDPAHEEAHRRLMRLYAAIGERHRALDQYEDLRTALRRELDADPDPASARLVAVIREGKLALTALVLPGAPAARHNLPVALTSFVGRAREVARVRDALERAHVVTLTGPGGCGKTRLAHEIARGHADRFADGAWLVDLANVTEPANVARAVAGVLDLREELGRSLDVTIARHLSAKRLLLVLDSCDRALERCATLASAILAVAPDLRVLVTSREPLRCEGEAVLPVPPLGVPQPATGPVAVADLMRSEAVQLFVERAQLADPQFALTPANSAAVARICRQLDGMPLAIELAAARVRSLPPEALAEHLADRLRLLALGTRTSVSRHATLAAAIDHSHDLLDVWERALFRRLAVFVGGWTIDAARQVAGFSGVPPNAVTDLLAHLVDRSLATVEADAASEVRYGFLETLRAYALERLDASDEAKTAGERHAACFEDLAERAHVEMDGPRQALWLQRLEREHDNLRAALRWSIDRADAETALRLAAALAPFWLRHSHLGEGRRWLEEALALAPEASSVERARALGGTGALARRQDDYAAARSRYEQAAALFSELGDRRGVAECLLGLALLAMSGRDYGRARALAEEALATQRDIGAGRDAALYVLGRVALDSGDQREARSHFEEALGDARARGDQFAIAGILALIGVVASDAGELVIARERTLECVDIYRRLGNRQELAYSLRGLGALDALQGDHRSAHSLLAESLATCRDLGDAMGVALALEELAVLAAARGLAARAYRLLGAAQVQRERIGREVAPSRAAVLERRLQRAREALSAERHEVLLDSGRGLDLDRAAAEALADTDV